MHNEFESFSVALRRFIRQSIHGPPSPQAPSFDQLATALYRLQYASNMPYRRLCNARGRDPSRVTNWREIPTVTCSAFKEYDFTCLPVSDQVRVFESSGTTQARRSRHAHSPTSLALYEASLLPWFQIHLLPETVSPTPLHESSSTAPQKLISLTPPPSQAPASSLVYMLHAVAQQSWFDHTEFLGVVGAHGWQVDEDLAIRRLRQFSDEGVKVLLIGTAFGFVHLLDALARCRIRLNLPAGSRVMETGGYKGRSRNLSKHDLHAWISDSLGVPTSGVVTEYGMTELGSQAYDRVVGKETTSDGLVFPPWARTQVICCESGKAVAPGGIGLLRVFDLANAFSVMAVETEDLAIQGTGGLALVGRRHQAEPRGCSLMAVETSAGAA